LESWVQNYQTLIVSAFAITGAVAAAYVALPWIRRQIDSRQRQPIPSTHETAMRMNVSLQATKVPGPESDAKQLVVRRVNWQDKKERTEQEAARTFCDLSGRKSWYLEMPGQNDPVDIRALSPDGQSTEEFQIVRLWDTTIWRQLNTEGAVDKPYTDQDAAALFRKRLESKGIKKYPDHVRGTLTLLIDANPIESASRFLTGLEDAIKPYARAVGYSAVWVVGTADVRRID
jgi:hypothetical protein